MRNDPFQIIAVMVVLVLTIVFGTIEHFLKGGDLWTIVLLYSSFGAIIAFIVLIVKIRKWFTKRNFNESEKSEDRKALDDSDPDDLPF